MVPALLQGRTCDDNPRWLVGNAKEVLDGVSKEEEADRALCAFHLMLFEGGCAKPDICGCERKKLKADKPVLWTVAGEKLLAGVDFDPAALFMQFVDPAYHGVLGRVENAYRYYVRHRAELVMRGAFGWPLAKRKYVMKDELTPLVGVTAQGALPVGTPIVSGLCARDFSVSAQTRRAKSVFLASKFERYLRAEYKAVPFDDLAREWGEMLARLAPVSLSRGECVTKHAELAARDGSEASGQLAEGGATSTASAARAPVAAAAPRDAASVTIAPPARVASNITAAHDTGHEERHIPVETGRTINHSVADASSSQGGADATPASADPAWARAARGMAELSQPRSLQRQSLQWMADGIRARGVTGSHEGYTHPGAHANRPMTADVPHVDVALRYVQMDAYAGAAPRVLAPQFTPGARAAGEQPQPSARTSPPWTTESQPTEAQYRAAASDVRHQDHDRVRPSTSRGSMDGMLE